MGPQFNQAISGICHSIPIHKYWLLLRNNTCWYVGKGEIRGRPHMQEIIWREIFVLEEVGYKFTLYIYTRIQFTLYFIQESIDSWDSIFKFESILWNSIFCLSKTTQHAKQLLRYERKLLWLRVNLKLLLCMDNVTTGCKSYNWVLNSIRLLAVFATQFPYINTDFCYVITPVGMLGKGK